MNRQTHTALAQSYKKKYESARYSVLIMALFTLVNCAFIIFGFDTYFLFSAPFIYYSLVNIKFNTGKFPAELYDEYEPFEFLPEGFYIAGIAIALIVIAVYVLCWFKSKDFHHKWLIASLILFCIDVAADLVRFGFYIDNIIDYIFAAYVIYSVASGIVAYTKLSKLPEPVEEPVPAAEDDFGFAERDFSYNDGNTENAEKKEEENK